MIVKFNVAVFKHPDELSDVKVYTPLAVYVKPFAAQVYETQEVSVKVDVEPLFVFCPSERTVDVEEAPPGAVHVTIH